MELGTPRWLEGLRDAINSSSEYGELARGWRWPLGLCVTTADETRYAVLDLRDGHCDAARVADRDAYDAAPFALCGTEAQWRRLLDGGEDPMRCIMLNQIELRGDRLAVLRFLPAAKALIEAAAALERDGASA